MENRITAWEASGLMVRGEKPLTIEEVFDHVPEIGSPVVQKALMVGGRRVDDWVANVRESDSHILGIVGRRYRVVQNMDAFRFGSDIIEQSGACIDSVGVVNGGSLVWFALNINHDVVVAGNQDERLSTYLLLSNGHDGKHAIGASIITLRLSCNNQLAFAIKNAQRTFRVRHTNGLDGRLMEARHALNVAFKYTDEIAALGEHFIRQPFDHSDLDDFLKTLVPLAPEPSDRQITIAENRRAAIKHTLFHAPDLEKIKHTKWGVLQAVSDWESHQTEVRSSRQNTREQARMARLLTGRQTYGNRALALLS